MAVETEKTTLSPNGRIAALKERVLRNMIQRVYVGQARLMTESYRETEGEPIIIRRAKALNHVLSNMSIGIADGELIVGDYIEAPGESGCPITIELGYDWVEDEMDGFPQRDGDKAFLTDEDKETLRGLFPYWKGRTLKDKLFPLLPEELRDRWSECSDVCGVEYRVGLGHTVPDYEKVITRGMEAITREASERLEELDISDPVQLAKSHFYRAVIIAGKAVTGFARRYAEVARVLEREEPDSQRKAELRQIAEVCERVSGQPARTFYEALQSLWFMHLAIHVEGFSLCLTPGRVDQVLFPYYRRDIEEGRLDREKAKELLLCFLIKLNTIRLLYPGFSTKFQTGWSIWQNITLGGVGRDGRDATNELSYLLLEADGELSMRSPETCIRIHRGTPRDFLIKALEVAKKCRGKLKFLGDDAGTKKLLSQGFTLEDARDYAMVGCADIMIAGKLNIAPFSYCIVPLCLELALNDGVSVLSGKQLGPRTGNPAEFKSIQDVIKAFLAQVDYVCENIARFCCPSVEAYAQVSPTPLLSSLVHGCLENGADVTGGGGLRHMWLIFSGAISVSDSLTAIKKCVFDEGKITMEELLDALHKDFEGKEEIRRMLMEAPKYGNDDDYADLMAREVIAALCDRWQSQKLYGGTIKPVIQIMGGPMIVAMGKNVGATADGRKSGEPLVSDGGVSPGVGRNVKGAAATFNSVVKLDHVKILGAEALNMRFSPETLKTDRAMQKWAEMLQTYFNLGGFHVQFNIVSTDMLKDAQKNPEKYKDLLVRVSTYSAYFVELNSDVQNQIISRTQLEIGD